MNYIFSRQTKIYDQLLEGGNFDDSFMSEDPDKKVYNNTYAEHIAYLESIKSSAKLGRQITATGLDGFKGWSRKKEENQDREKQMEIDRQRFRNKPYIFYLNGEELKCSKTSTFYSLNNESRLRFFLVWLVHQKWFDFFIIAAILINSIMMGAKNYTDFEDKTPINRFIVQTNPIFNTVIYCECILKIIAMGFYFGKYTYLSEAWNWLDLFVVTSSLMNDIMDAVASGQGGGKGLSALRAVRLLRPLKLLSKIPAIRVLISTLLNSIAGLGGIMGLAMFFFSIFSILGITVWNGRIHYRCYMTPEPIDGEWELLSGYTKICSSSKLCPTGSFCRSRFEVFNKDGSPYKFNDPDLWKDTYIEELFWGFNNFDNIGFALLTVFQVTTMDGWTVIMNIYENAGSQSFSWMYFISCVIVCSFFILNLTVAQMIMKYDEISSQQHSHDQFENELYEMSKDIFEDDQQEIVNFIIEEDKAQISPDAAKYLSKKQSFIQSFFTAQKVVINEESKYYRNSIVRQCLTIIRSKHFNGFIIIVIILNTIALSMDKYPEYPDDILMYFSYLNIVFTVVFTIEAAIKLIALGFRPFMSEGFNVFDIFIVMSSIFQIYLEYTGSSQKGGLILILRTLRVFRIFKLFKVGDLRMLIDSITYTIPVIGPYVILLSFFMYIFALVAMSFYAGQIKFDDNGKVDIINGTTVRENYNDLGTSLLTIFQVLMGAEWRFIWYQHMLAQGMTASLYYIALHIVIGIIMLNLFLAIMLGNFDKARSYNAKKQIFEAFRELLHEREDMYSMHQVCDIVMGDMSEHVKYNVLKLGKPGPNKLELAANGLPKPNQDPAHNEIEEGQREPEKKKSIFENYSLGLFHIDSKFRKFCLILSVEKSTYEDLKRQREVLRQNAGDNKEQQLTTAQLDYKQKKQKVGTDWYKIFDNLVLVAICISSMMLPLENPVSDPKSKAVIYAKNANIVFSIFFLCELMIKIIGKGFIYSSIVIIEPYMASGWNRIDAFVVLISVIQLIYIFSGIQSQFAALKAMRALRALRPLRVIRRFDNLRVVVNALLSTIGAINNVMLVGFLLLLMFAVMGINLLKGSLYSCSIGGSNIVTKQDCLDAGGSWNNNDSNFDNIVQAMRTLFILCTTEGWAGLMFMGVDSRGIDMQPLQDYNPYMSLYFVIVMITGSLFIMNMFVGVVIDNFNKIKEKEELGSSYVTDEQRQWLIYQQIGQQKQLRKKIMEPTNFRKYFFRLVHHPHFDNFITFVVATNTLFLAIKSYQMSSLLKITLKYANYVFAVIFNMEMLLKLCALGKQYFISSWNKFDMFIVMTADIGIILDILNLQKNFQTVATILRAFRIVRVVKLLQKFRSIKIIIDSTLNILPSITNVLSLLALITYVYACFGIYLFAGTKRRAELDSVNNFSSFGRAMLGLIRYSTGEDFQEFMYEFSQESNCIVDQTYEDIQKNGYLGCGSWLAIPYFMSFQVIAGWLILNLTIAAVIDGLQAAQADDNRLFKSSDIDDFLDMWQEYDHHGAGTISLKDFFLFLAELQPPFGTGANLKEKLTEKKHDKYTDDWETPRKKDGYFYNDARNFRVRKILLLYDILDLQLKVSLSAEDEILIEFSEAYKGLIKRSFYYQGIENYKLQDEKANKKLIRGWLKKSSSNRDADTQTAVSKEDKNYLTQYLAATIIQEFFMERKMKKEQKKQFDLTSLNINRDKKTPSQLVILEPRIQPQNFVRSLEDEFYEMKNQKAKRVFLNSCNKFSQQKIKKNLISAQDYSFSKKDFINNMLYFKELEKIYSNVNANLQRVISDNEVKNMFKVENIKISPDVIFVDSRLIIMVKAWQKVTLKSEKMMNMVHDLKDPSSKKLVRRLSQKDSNFGLDQYEAKKDSYFYIKTLQFYDYRGQPLSYPLREDQQLSAICKFEDSGEDLEVQEIEEQLDYQHKQEPQEQGKVTPKQQSLTAVRRTFSLNNPILVEQVSDIAYDESFYDVSFVHNGSKIYFYKRIYYQNKKLGDFFDENRRKVCISRLVLYSFDVLTGEEQAHPNIFYDEYKKEDSEFATEFNITFSKSFGKSHHGKKEPRKNKDGEKISDSEVETEEEFLSRQFFLMQKYEKGAQIENILNRISLFSMRNLGSNWDDDLLFISENFSYFDGISCRYMNSQASSINHKEFYKGDLENIFFIITNMQSTVQITFNKKTKKVLQDHNLFEGCEPRVYMRDDVTLNSAYLWNQSEIRIQGMDIKSFNDQDEEERIEQYFFVDPRNQIQLIFPNYDLKAMRNKLKSLIMEQTNITQMPYTRYKKINCLSYNCNPYHGIECEDDSDSSDEDEEDHCHHRYHNVVQKIDDLTAILDYDVIFKDHQVTFCNSLDDQILFISEMNSRSISLFSMQQIDTILCEHSKCAKQILEETQKALLKKVAQEIKSIYEDAENNSGLNQKSLNSNFKNATGKYSFNQQNTNLQNASKFNLRKQNLRANGISFIDGLDNELNPHNEDDEGEVESNSFKKYFDENELLSINDRREEYIYNLDEQDRAQVDKLSAEERLNYVYIDDFKGKKVKVKVFDYTNNNDLKNKMRVKLVRHQPSSLYACFVFAVYSIKEKEIDQVLSVNVSVIKQYIFVTKNNYEMNTLFTGQSSRCLIDEDDEVHVIKSSFEAQLVPWHVMRAFQLQDTNDIIVKDLLKNDFINEQGNILPFKKINLTFSKQLRKKANINFMSFIYQESQNTDRNSFINFDIFQQRMTPPINISPSNESKDYLYQDERGFNSFQLCRTSDIFEQVDSIKSFGQEKKLKKQMVRYAFFFLFSEKIGRLQGEEFLVTHSKKGMITQTIGYKEIILSKKIIEHCEWGCLKNSYAVSYLEEKTEIIKGTKLVFQVSHDEISIIKILDQERNNQYVYQSDVVLAGHQKFQLYPGDEEQFIIVTSCMLRNQFIHGMTFSRDEAYYILQQCMKNILTMRICTLDFLILNTFDDMRGDAFFQPQEILCGKSICDISLNDTIAVQTALRNREEDDYNCPGSIMDSLVRDDQVRKQTFKEIHFYPKTMIVHYDLNFVGTIERAIKFKYFISLRMIIDHIFDEINTNDYNSQIMCALPCVISQKQVNINHFFRMSRSDKKEKDKKTFCNIEIPFQDIELPIFSNYESQHIINSCLENFHELEGELANLILQRERGENSQQRNFIVEHTYIDFTSLIIGEKIRMRFGQDISFDDIYLSQLFLKFGNLNKTIYQQDSVQKIIDYQWVQTSKIMKASFFIYIFFYCFPICMILFTDDDHIHRLMLQICLIPALILFMIEMIQFQDLGWVYFTTGWNNCDFMQFVIFIIIFLFNEIGIEDSFAFMPELRIILVILSLIKLLFFLRVFEEYGFLVQIIMVCCIDLIPFITFYLIFLLMFSVVFVVLQMQVDKENNQMQHIGFFEKMLMETFRSSIGEVGLPKYDILANQPDSFNKTLLQLLIWAMWFIQVFFMLVIMLNFLITVLQQTYNRVMNYQKIILYQQRAELNEECYNLMSIFFKLKSFKYIVFSTNKEIKKDQNHNYAEISEIIQQYVIRDKKAMLKGHDELKQKLMQCKESQKILESKLEKNFGDILKKFENVHVDLRGVIEKQQQNQG